MANKYVVVAGEMNCGAEIVMKILDNLGQSVTDGATGRSPVASAMISSRKDLEAKNGRVNRGTYEFNDVRMGIKVAEAVTRKAQIQANNTMSAPAKEKAVAMLDSKIKVLNDNQNKAVMLTLRGLMASDVDVLNNSKIIICLRDPKYIGYTEAELNALPAPRKETILRFANSGRLFGASILPELTNFLNSHPTVVANSLMVDYEALIKTPDVVIGAMTAFLGITVSAPVQAGAGQKVSALKVQRTGKYAPTTPSAVLNAQSDMVASLKNKDIAGAKAKDVAVKDAKKAETKAKADAIKADKGAGKGKIK
jgi:hypothetical protein